MRLSAKETDLVRACLGWLALHRVKAWRMNNTGIFDPARKVFRTFHGLAGVSDILGILPRTAGGDSGGLPTLLSGPVPGENWLPRVPNLAILVAEATRSHHQPPGSRTGAKRPSVSSSPSR
jgi:hypothetical protein